MESSNAQLPDLCCDAEETKKTKLVSSRTSNRTSVARSTAGAALSRPPIAILGVPFDNVNKREAIERIEEMVASRQPHYFVTPNVDFLTRAKARASGSKT